MRVTTSAVSSIALYGLMDELSDASVHRSLSELSPIVDDPRYSGQVLLGGDLNTGAQRPEGDAFNDRDRNVLDRIAALGLVDCIRAKRAPDAYPDARAPRVTTALMCGLAAITGTHRFPIKRTISLRRRSSLRAYANVKY